jgi:serine/threonine protein kinase
MDRGNPSLAGVVLDAKYRLVELIGQGGMGAVYRALHLGTQRPVAVKVLLSNLVNSPQAVERFRREARAAGGLRHPNVVDVTDFGVASVDGCEIAYIAMEYLEGASLRGLLDERGALPVEVVLDIVEQIAAALEVAHAAGIVHRDLKPENVWLVQDGRGGVAVRVLDFGIALVGNPDAVGAAAPMQAVATTSLAFATHESDGDGAATQLYAPYAAESGLPSGDSDRYRLTGAGSLVGTPHYMSPEQFRSEAVTTSSDVYALGVIAWECIAGRRPFRGELHQVMHGHLHEAPPSLPNASSAVSALLVRALAKSPGDRFGSARALAGGLRAAAEDSGALLRYCIALYANRFGEMSAVAWRCGRVPVLLSALGSVLACAYALADPLDPDRAKGAWLCSTLWATGCWGVVTMTTNASYALAIQRLRSRPLESLRAADLEAELRTRIGLPVGAGALRTSLRLALFYFRHETRAPVGSGDLAFLIGLLEQRPIPEIGARCAELVQASKRFRRPVVLGLFAGLLLLPLLETGLLLNLGLPFGAIGRTCARIIGTGLMPFNAVLVNPVFSSALTLVYYRARQAHGEDVPMAAVLPGRL